VEKTGQGAFENAKDRAIEEVYKKAFNYAVAASKIENLLNFDQYGKISVGLKGPDPNLQYRANVYRGIMLDVEVCGDGGCSIGISYSFTPQEDAQKEEENRRVNEFVDNFYAPLAEQLLGKDLCKDLTESAARNIIKASAKLMKESQDTKDAAFDLLNSNGYCSNGDCNEEECGVCQLTKQNIYYEEGRSIEMFLCECTYPDMGCDDSPSDEDEPSCDGGNCCGWTQEEEDQIHGIMEDLPKEEVKKLCEAKPECKIGEKTGLCRLADASTDDCICKSKIEIELEEYLDKNALTDEELIESIDEDSDGCPDGECIDEFIEEGETPNEESSGEIISE